MAKKNTNSSLPSAAHHDHANNVTKNSVVKVKRTRRSMPRDSPPQRSSIYRGVTRHRWTGRYEAHLWDKNCWNESQNKKGRQVYLGAYDDEETAAHAYDLAALKYWGQETILNFPLSTYENELKAMEGQSREEYIGSLRRKSSGFSRGVSKYRGVARHHHNGRWEARIGRVFGNKYLYLGTYATQEEAATAYDMAAIEYRGLNAVTNFDLSRYIKWLKPNNNQNDNKIVPANIQPDGYNNPSSNNLNSEVVTPNINYVDTIPKHNQELAFFPKAGNNNQQSSHEMVAAQPRPATATSALGLLLQSSKFKEMMEMTSVADCPSIMVPNSSQLPQGSFPDDIQTYFDCQDLSNLVDDHSLFGELNSFVSPAMFHCDFDV